ncbi:MAG: sigma-54-dependent Fis family transcriptional regulator [Gemmatimonadota bacterium]|nr:MAG: sigma-54-dependent Fis family transcriptional regulator [Gemmatimonadota bacterium]
MMKRSILIVDDDAWIRDSLTDALSRSGDEVRAAEDAEAALTALADARADVVLTDVRMPGMDGLELLRLLRDGMPDVAVVLMTAYDDLPTVSAAMREGAADFLVKPLDLHQLRGVIERVFEDRQARAAAAQAPKDAVETDLADRLIGHDPQMVDIFKVIGQVAASRTNVVIRGESGTGKELIARAIHSNSPYADEPFVPVNCTALPSTLLESELFGHVRGSFTGASSDRRGRFALAGKGTIFLDEIGDTSLEFQSKLLRVLQEHEYYPVGAERSERTEGRVIAATHGDLERMVEEGEFREDLYYRLRVVEIVVPPLRDRRADIPELAEHLVRKASAAVGRSAPVLAPEARDALLAHAWPGNVRELENCLTRAVVLATGDVIRPEHLALGPPVAEPRRRVAKLDEVERDHVAYVLETMRGNKSRAAEALGISRPRLVRLIKKYGLAESRPQSDEEAERAD